MRVHFINVNQDFDIAYFPNTKRFFKINSNGKKLIQLMSNDERIDSIMEQMNIDKDQYNQYYDLLAECNEAVCDKEDCNKDCNKECNKECNKSSDNKKILSRLVIHLTNDCNLRCKYCYAHGGKYLSERRKLNEEMLDKTIERFYSEFDEIQFIQFFGGEPLLNMNLMEKACEKIRSIDSERKCTTHFGLVTNGTLINDRFINIVKKYGIEVTVSYDGYPLVNNLLRVFPNGEGTSDIILKNAKLLKEATGEPSTIEVTYTQYHIDNHISIMDVVKHIQKELPDTYIHLVPAGGEDDSDLTVKDLDVFADSINDIFKECENVKEGETVPSYSLADRIFLAISHKEVKGSPYICDAGIGTMSVAVDGNIYPCFMFTDQKDLLLGNIYDDDLFNSPKYRSIMDNIYKFSVKENNSECKKCFINTLCNGCLGLNSLQSGEVFKLNTKTCDMFRKMTDAALINFAKREEMVKAESKSESEEELIGV